VNPRYWNLINEFRKLTGIPMLLNTSFNIQEPIVCSPQDAVRAFIEGNLDYLSMGPFFVTAKSRGKIPSEVAALNTPTVEV
jgi:carbamoyltransferase